VTVKLWNTSAPEVQRAITEGRRAAGEIATGLVLTLVVLTDERSLGSALAAAEEAAVSHPCRQLAVVVSRPDGSDARLDAEVAVGAEHNGPGEAVTLRMSGRLALHADSVVLPLLAADTPVFCWWSGEPPQRTAFDSIGRLASRRITDCAAAADPLSALAVRAREYVPGDTDLSWTRLTGWRSVLASVMDTWNGPVEHGEVSVEPGNPSGWLLASWLESRLGAPMAMRNTRGPGITSVRLSGHSGGQPAELSIERVDGVRCLVRRSGQPEHVLPIPRRDLTDLLAEELRRSGADQPFGDALAYYGSRRRERLQAAADRA
jgi:glucose-6-phosphate dehydrogenase assembly protein OpcA